VTDSRENGNEPSGYVKGREFHYWPLKMDSADFFLRS